MSDQPEIPAYLVKPDQREYTQKDTNPKDDIGSTKLPLHLVPSTLRVFASLAFLEGALKYGKFNWRIAGVRTSIYTDALERHLEKFKNGEWADPQTGVPHLANILACAGIILDAAVCGKLKDDRAPAAPVAELIDNMIPTVAGLKDTFAEYNPHQYTIEDSTHAHTRIDGCLLSAIPREPESKEGTGGAEPGEA